MSTFRAVVRASVVVPAVEWPGWYDAEGVALRAVEALRAAVEAAGMELREARATEIDPAVEDGGREEDRGG